MANTSLALTELDYDTLKSRLITYMRSQPLWRDYDFVGSNLNQLISLLSYNSHLNAFYTNMLMSESYLDSAQLKSSVLSRSKELNYVPLSARSSKATINFSFEGPQPTYVLQKGQTFSTQLRNKTMTFSIPENTLLTSANGQFSANIDIYEGVYLADAYVINRNDPTQRFVVKNANVDITSLSVQVYEDGSVLGNTYARANTLLGLTGRSKVYFLQQAETEEFEVSFGDGVIGYRPKDGSRVVLDYRVTRGPEADGCRIFVSNFNPGPTEDASQLNVQTISVASDGQDAQDIEAIRFYAPRHFQVQERATSEDDFPIVLMGEFPEIRSVATYGGETVEPPQYGKVMIAVDLTGVDGLPESKKKAYTDFLKHRMSLTMVPVFTVPDRTYLGIDTEVTYNINLTTLSEDNISALVTAAIAAFGELNLNNFGKRLRYSRLSAAIDAIDTAIVGNQTEVVSYKRAKLVTFGTPTHTTLNFGFELLQGHADFVPDYRSRGVWSSPFTFASSPARLEDDGKGGVWIVGRITDAEQYLRQVGTVDYATGTVQLTNLLPDSYEGPFIKVFARSVDKDIASPKNTILEIRPDDVTVTPVPVRE
jgi:hypothetical protein